VWRADRKSDGVERRRHAAGLSLKVRGSVSLTLHEVVVTSSRSVDIRRLYLYLKAGDVTSGSDWTSGHTMHAVFPQQSGGLIGGAVRGRG